MLRLFLYSTWIYIFYAFTKLKLGRTNIKTIAEYIMVMVTYTYVYQP